MRRLIVLAIVGPYALVMWPQWAARDVVIVLCKKYRERQARSQEARLQGTRRKL
jgi:hypothetical protein